MCRIALLLMVCVACGCSKAPAPTVQSSSIQLEGLPITITVKQRATTVISGSNGKISITTGDITKGQVDTSLVDIQGKPILSPVSMKPGDTRLFIFENRVYSLRLDRLSNAIVGEDFATFTIVTPDQATTSDTVLIEKLLTAIEASEGTQFTRNGTDYTAKEAANHLRIKYEAAREQVHSAQDFIDKIASKSSTSGEEYMVSQPGKSAIKAREFLMHELKKLKP